jgi:NAD(P)-dependent dehydrogenase (short-subunit alcohol dehydrogenase family)
MPPVCARTVKTGGIYEMKKVVVTGAAGGLGMAAVKFMVRKGWKVYALDRDEEGLQRLDDPHIIPVQVDITDEESIDRAVAEVSKDTGSLDGIVNLAGILILGSLIESEVVTLHRILDINLLGMYRINRAFFEMIRQGQGRIINISSETGVLSPAPFSGFYYISKHAVEVYNDVLRRELAILGIPVIKIRPGAFSTQMTGEATFLLKNAMNSSVYFKNNIEKGLSMAESETGHAKDPHILAKLIHRALTDPRPRLVYSSNLNRRLQFLSLLPEHLQDLIYLKVMGGK